MLYALAGSNPPSPRASANAGAQDNIQQNHPNGCRRGHVTAAITVLAVGVFLYGVSTFAHSLAKHEAVGTLSVNRITIDPPDIGGSFSLSNNGEKLATSLVVVAGSIMLAFIAIIIK